MGQNTVKSAHIVNIFYNKQSGNANRISVDEELKEQNMVPVAQLAERVTVDHEVEGSFPFRHPSLCDKNAHISKEVRAFLFNRIIPVSNRLEVVEAVETVEQLCYSTENEEVLYVQKDAG